MPAAKESKEAKKKRTFTKRLKDIGLTEADLNLANLRIKKVVMSHAKLMHSDVFLTLTNSAWYAGSCREPSQCLFASVRCPGLISGICHRN